MASNTNRNSTGGSGGISNDDTLVGSIPSLNQSRIDELESNIRNMTDEEISEFYEVFQSNYVFVRDNDNFENRRFVNPNEGVMSEGIRRGPRNNLNQEFLNLNKIRLRLGTEMLTRNIDNEYGYSDVPYYTVENGEVTFHQFIPTGD